MADVSKGKGAPNETSVETHSEDGVNKQNAKGDTPTNQGIVDGVGNDLARSFKHVLDSTVNAQK